MKHKNFRTKQAKTFSTVVILFCALALTGCKKEEATTDAQDKDFTFFNAIKVSEENIGASGPDNPDACIGIHYGYDGADGPEHWSDLCNGWSACNDGQAQSPVNIDNAVHDKTLQPLKFQWATTTTKIVNNGHTIQFNVDDGSKIVTNGKTYKLLQFHFHHVSEHTVKGKYFPLEVHFVHSDDSSKLAVVGVMFKEGAPNNLFSTFMQNFPTPMTTYASPATINLSSLLPSNQRYYNYKGSLTSPNCSETVDWHVLKGAVTASKEQIEMMKHIIHDNNRPIQPLNGRTVKMSMGSGNGNNVDDL